MKFDTVEEFFDRLGEYNINVNFYENHNAVAVEELYQHFKARLIHELRLDIHKSYSTGQYFGRLVEPTSRPKETP